MMRVEEIKGKRQAQYIFDRQKKARQIEKEKDIKEVQRDMVIIYFFGRMRSIVLGLKHITSKQFGKKNFFDCTVTIRIPDILGVRYSKGKVQ